VLSAENEGLRRDLESMRGIQETNLQLNNQFQDERQMRINSEADIARLREQLADCMSTSKTDIDNLRRAIDDMKYKHEEAIRQVNIKNEEIESMMD